MPDQPRPPTPKELTLADTTGKLVRDDTEFPVYLLPSGEFGIRWGNLFLRKPTMKAIDAFIQKASTQKTLRVFGGDADDEPKDAKEFEEKRIVFSDGTGQRVSYWSDWYVYDPEVVALLEEKDKEIERHEAEIRKIREQRQKIKDRLKQVRHSNFKELVEKYGTEPGDKPCNTTKKSTRTTKRPS